MDFNNILKIVYAVFLAYILKQLYDIFRVRKGIKGTVIAYYSPKIRMLAIVLSIMLVILGGITIASKDYFGIVFILIGIGFGYINMEKVIVYTNGIYFNGRMDTWEEIKRWQYNDATNNLELKTTKIGTKENRLIPIKAENRDELLTIIKDVKKKKK